MIRSNQLISLSNEFFKKVSSEYVLIPLDKSIREWLETISRSRLRLKNHELTSGLAPGNMKIHLDSEAMKYGGYLMQNIVNEVIANSPPLVEAKCNPGQLGKIMLKATKRRLASELNLKKCEGEGLVPNLKMHLEYLKDRKKFKKEIELNSALYYKYYYSLMEEFIPFLATRMPTRNPTDQIGFSTLPSDTK